MNQKAFDIWREFKELPPEAQREVIDFIIFLRKRYLPECSRRAGRKTELADEPFIGMWRYREDFGNSTAWIRNVREREWVKHCE